MRISLLTLLLAIGGTLTLVHAQPNPSAVYGDARSPFVCASKKEPTIGAPSGDRLKDLVRCGKVGERISDNRLYLLDNLQVEIGEGRPYQASDSLIHDIDQKSLVYPIRGSYDMYQCNPINPFMGLKGHSVNHNCMRHPNPKAEGICYKTTFGDWECDMHDPSTLLGPLEFNLPPPK